MSADPPVDPFVEVIGGIGPFAMNCYIAACRRTGAAAIIDPGDEADVILSRVRELRLTVAALLHTHGHLDHVGATARLAAPPAPDLTPSTFTAAYDSPLLTGLAYTLTLRNSGSLTATIAVSDALPAALTLSGPVNATAGLPVWDGSARTWHWQGEVAPEGMVTITCHTYLDPWLAAGAAVRNVAQVGVTGTGEFSLEARARSPWRWRVPLATWP
jgi:uncharacterized repeat protein (TIGR01451 family)